MKTVDICIDEFRKYQACIVTPAYWLTTTHENIRTHLDQLATIPAPVAAKKTSDSQGIWHLREVPTEQSVTKSMQKNPWHHVSFLSQLTIYVETVFN